MSGLEAHPYDWRVTKDGTVRVSRGGRVVSVVGGAKGRALAAALDRADGDAAQHLLARATGHYKHGNERR